MKNNVLRIVSRKSPMAWWQANYIHDLLLAEHPGLEIELIGMSTQGDRDTMSSLVDLGGKSVFVKELQRGLLCHEADIAVHCIKDMSVSPVDGLMLGAVCQRTDPGDALISNNYQSLNELPAGATVGTGSPRRESYIRSLRPDVDVCLLRGNVNTRLSKLDAGEYDAIILATSGLARMDMLDRIRQQFNVLEFIPAIGQGALGIECRRDDAKTLKKIAFLHDENSAICIQAERRVNQILEGDCHSAIGAYARIIDNEVELRAMVGSITGVKILTAQAKGSLDTPEKIGEQVANDLIQQGAKELLCEN